MAIAAPRFSFSNDILTVHSPGINELIGTSKPVHVDVLGPAWTLAVAEYDFPPGPDISSVQVPIELTVCKSVRIEKALELWLVAVISIPTCCLDELTDGAGVGLGSLPVLPCDFIVSPV